MDTQSLINQNKSLKYLTNPESQRASKISAVVLQDRTECTVAVLIGLYPLGRAEKAPETLFPRTGWHVGGF